MDDERPWWRQADGRPAWARRIDAAPPEQLWRFYAAATIVLIVVVIVGLLSGTVYVVALCGPMGIFGGKAIRGWRTVRRSGDHTAASASVSCGADAQ